MFYNNKLNALLFKLQTPFQEKNYQIEMRNELLICTVSALFSLCFQTFADYYCTL